jgi:hypothetical protein
MIHDIAIWKLVLAGVVLASFSFLVGFFIAALCAAAGKASRAEEALGELAWLYRHKKVGGAQ